MGVYLLKRFLAELKASCMTAKPCCVHPHLLPDVPSGREKRDRGRERDKKNTHIRYLTFPRRR